MAESSRRALTVVVSSEPVAIHARPPTPGDVQLRTVTRSNRTSLHLPEIVFPPDINVDHRHVGIWIGGATRRRGLASLHHSTLRDVHGCALQGARAPSPGAVETIPWINALREVRVVRRPA